MHTATAKLAAILLLTTPHAARAVSIDVFAAGARVGVLDVSTYTAGETPGQGPLEPSATATIAADFAKTGIAAAGQAVLEAWFPLGLTYMQTVLMDTDRPQQLAFSAKGQPLAGTWSDPPQRGILLFGQGAFLQDDVTPWYSTADPAGVAGEIPPSSPGRHQFFDMPTLPFTTAAGFDALAAALNGRDGAVRFETALVGVASQPVDDPLTVADERLADPYEVVVLKTFRWGLDIGFADDGLPGFAAEDYSVAALPLVFADATSAEFESAFDQLGSNADVEWDVRFLANVPGPPTAPLLIASWPGGGAEGRNAVREVYDTSASANYLHHSPNWVLIATSRDFFHELDRNERVQSLQETPIGVRGCSTSGAAGPLGESGRPLLKRGAPRGLPAALEPL